MRSQVKSDTMEISFTKLAEFHNHSNTESSQPFAKLHLAVQIRHVRVETAK